MSIIELNSESFRPTVKSSPLPILVMFSSETCSPCKRLKSVLEGLAGEVEGKALLAYLQAEDAITVCQEEGIRSFPTVIVYQNGIEKVRKVGLLTKQQVLFLLA
jgi:thioredoxin-like negative regulator of GroEL